MTTSTITTSWITMMTRTNRKDIYGLDVLINDKSEFVRLTAQEKLNSTP